MTGARCGLFITVLVTTLIAGIPAMSVDAYGFEEQCEVSIAGFDHIFSSGSRESKIRVVAEKACAPKMGLPFQLSQVRVEIYEGTRIVAVRSAPTALFNSENEKLIGQFGNEVVFMDFEAGVIRSPGHLTELR